ncbi:MAG: glycosyltransferase [Kofleriaceae bacterium]|nr:glycosyltransferase [Kofleriaceae bacterium]
MISTAQNSAEPRMPVVGALRHHFLPPSETFIYNSIRGVTRYQTRVFSISRKSEEKFKLPNITALRSLPFGTAEGVLYRATTYSPRFFRWAKEVDILHAHMGYTGVHGLMAAKKFGLPLVTSFYGNDIAILQSSQKRKVEYWHFWAFAKALFRRGNRFLVLSADMKTKLEELGCPSEKISINALGIDLEAFRTKREARDPQEVTRVLMVGREVQKKGFDDGLRACAAALAQGANIALSIHGNNGPLHHELRSLAAELKLDINWIEPTSSVVEAMRGADLLLVPSRTADNGDREGTPTVICEGSAAGLPIVATRHAGIPEQVVSGTTGLLSNEGDVADLAQSLIELSEKTELCLEMGLAAERKAQSDFGIVSHCARLQSTYDELIGKHL